MIKKIIVSICLLFAIGAMAQQGSASPYSFYGIGDVKFKGTAEAAAMGGIGVFPDSIHLNLQNPASYTSLKLTTLAFGGTYSNSNLKTNTHSENVLFWTSFKLLSQPNDTVKINVKRKKLTILFLPII